MPTNYRISEVFDSAGEGIHLQKLAISSSICFNSIYVKRYSFRFLLRLVWFTIVFYLIITETQ